LQKLDLKAYVSDVKVIENNAYVYNSDINCIYEVSYSMKGNISKKIYLLSELIKNKVQLHETPYYYDSVILLQKDHVRLNFNKINLIIESNEVSTNRNKLANSIENLKEARKNNFDDQMKKSERLSKSRLEISDEFDMMMYPVNKYQDNYKKGTAISPSHYKMSSIYSMISNINKSVERRKSHSPMAYFKKVNESISSDTYNGIGKESMEFNQNTKKMLNTPLSPNYSNKLKKFDFTTNVKILEKENLGLPKLKISDIIKTNSENTTKIEVQDEEYIQEVQTSLNQISSPVNKNTNKSLTIDSINKLSVAGTKVAELSTFTPKSSVCTNRQTNFTVNQSQIVRSHNYSFSINQEVGKSTSMSDIKTFTNLNNQTTKFNHSNDFNFSELHGNESTQTTQLPSLNATPYLKKSIQNRPKLSIVKKNSEPIKLLNKSSNDIEIPTNYMRHSLLEQSKKMEILSIRDQPQLIMESNIDKNFERKNTLQPLELEGTHTFQTRRSDVEFGEIETQCREHHHKQEVKDILDVQEIVNTQEINIENTTNYKMDTFNSDKKEKPENIFNNIQNLNASFKSSSESFKQSSPKKLGLIKKAKYNYQENNFNFKPVKNANLNNSVNLSSTLEQNCQSNILSSSNAFSTKSQAKVNVIDIYTQKARERSQSVSNQSRTPTKPQARKSRDPNASNTSNTSFSSYIKHK
jgi:hypothetical protein